RELIARGAVRRSDERGASLDDVLGARIGLLPEAAQRLLETIAVAGAPIRRSDAYLAASLAAEDVSAEQLRSERLLRGAPSSDGEPRLETYHDRVRETILARLAPAALRDHHQRLAAALSRDGRGDPHALARHYEGAGEARLAAEYFARAAESAAEKLAFDHAAGLYQRAIELQPERAAAWWAPLAETLSFAGRGRESGEAFERAAQFAPPREALALQQKAAAQYLGAGRLDDGVALLQKMLGALGVRLPNSQFEAIVRILALRVRLAWRGLGVKTPAGGIDARAREEIEEQFQIIGALTVADPLRGQCLQSQVLLSCLERGDPVGSARAIAYQTLQFALASRRPGRAEKAYFARARELAAEVKRPEVDATVTLCEGVAAYLHGSWGVAADRCTQAGAMLEACSSRFRWDREVTRIWELNALYFLGDFRLLAERLKPVMSSAAARNDLHSLVNHGTFTQAMLMIADDRADEAVQSIDDLLARWSQSGFHVPHYNGLLMQAHAALYNGDLVAARERTDRCLRGAKSARMDWLQIIRVTLDGFAARVALAEVQAGADRRTLREVDATARRLAREGVRWSHATSLGLRAGAAHLRGDRDGATRLLREAEAEFQAAEMDLHAACCRRQWARLVGGEEGRAALAEPDALLRRQLVKEPARFAELVATGFATV
ncbi:MAG TPA: hypothetical protein VGE52_20465, partial [Pirellulales bacterium]